MKIDVFNLRQVQDTIAMLSVAKAAGLVTIDDVLQALSTQKTTDKPDHKNNVTCGCGRGPLLPKETIDGLKRIGCCKCGYSEVVE